MVTQRLCPRCHLVVRFEDDNDLHYCTHCGAPQLRLSAELTEQAEAQAEREASARNGDGAISAPEPAAVVPPQRNRWTGAIQCALLGGLVAAALTLLSFAAPPVAIFTVGWLVGAPIILTGIYAARHRHVRITASFASRLGVLSGVAILLGIITLNTAHLCLERFVFHHAGDIDQQIASAFAQQEFVLRARMGAEAAPTLALLDIPEFRASMLISGFAMVSAIYLIYTAAAGAFAGLLRSRPGAR
jgi:hypothetical protein